MIIVQRIKIKYAYKNNFELLKFINQKINDKIKNVKAIVNFETAIFLYYLYSTKTLLSHPAVLFWTPGLPEGILSNCPCPLVRPWSVRL